MLPWSLLYCKMSLSFIVAVMSYVFSVKFYFVLVVVCVSLCPQFVSQLLYIALEALVHQIPKDRKRQINGDRHTHTQRNILY